MTITVSPGGAASPARRDAPRRSSGIPCVRTAAPGFRRRRTLPSLCHSLRTVRRAGARRERTSSLSCKASCGQPLPKSVAATPPVIPCVRTAEPWIRRRRTPPSSCHSLRADNRARTSSRTHLRPRARPLRVQTASLQVRPPALGTCIQLAIAYDGDIPRGRVRVLPSGGIRRRRGQHSRPRARRMPPAATPESGRRAPPALTGRGGSPLSQQPGAFGEDRQVHPVTGTDPLLRTAQVGLDG